ncbi:hypothetical protein OAS39_09670 [Pirellulales bacterium]|nr:hypothetical protein [Pirellulales bacterium]
MRRADEKHVHGSVKGRTTLCDNAPSEWRSDQGERQRPYNGGAWLWRKKTKPQNRLEPG